MGLGGELLLVGQLQHWPPTTTHLARRSLHWCLLGCCRQRSAHPPASDLDLLGFALMENFEAEPLPHARQTSQAKSRGHLLQQCPHTLSPAAQEECLAEDHCVYTRGCLWALTDCKALASCSKSLLQQLVCQPQRETGPETQDRRAHSCRLSSTNSQCETSELDSALPREPAEKNYLPVSGTSADKDALRLDVTPDIKKSARQCSPA
mmetsp:Transcript_142235/g.247995  ORF Transcript_142235/g.247995 Transcript_142235/m.247995 type:complete len:207 (+) Transcript_142235:806-1426(+)